MSRFFRSTLQRLTLVTPRESEDDGTREHDHTETFSRVSSDSGVVPHAGAVQSGSQAEPRASASGFRGELISHDLIELVQLVITTMPSGALQVWSPQGRGTIWLDQGMIVHALCGHDEGEAAFQRMLHFPCGHFSVRAGDRAPERTITSSTTQLLLESAVSLDEQQWNENENEISEEPTQPIIRTAAEYFEHGLSAVKDKLYEQALMDWERAHKLEPDNRVYQHNLRRLQQLLAINPESSQAGGNA
jgi:hypothetical protein